MAYPDGVSFRGTPYANEDLPSHLQHEAESLKAAIKSIEAIKENTRLQITAELTNIMGQSWAATACLRDEAKTDTPAETLTLYAMDCFGTDLKEYVLDPLQAALDEVLS